MQRSEAPIQEAGELALTGSPVQLGLCPAPLLPVQTPVLAVVASSECQWGGGLLFHQKRQLGILWKLDVGLVWFGDTSSK